MNIELAVEKQTFVISELLKQDTKQFSSIYEANKNMDCSVPMRLVKDLEQVLCFLTKQK